MASRKRGIEIVGTLGEALPATPASAQFLKYDVDGRGLRSDTLRLVDIVKPLDDLRAGMLDIGKRNE